MKISSKEFQEIVKEECIRIKKRMMLESKKQQILKEMQECDMMDENTPNMTPVQDSSIGSKEDLGSKAMHNVAIILSRLSLQQKEKLADDMQMAGSDGSNVDFKKHLLQTLPMNEAPNETWDKSKIYNWLVGAGLGVTAAGIASAAIGAAIEPELSSNLNPAILAGIASIVLGAISSGVGMYKKNTAAAAQQQQLRQNNAASVMAKRKTSGRR